MEEGKGTAVIAILELQKGEIYMTLKSKVTSLGLIEVRELGGCRYGLYVAGTLKMQSSDLDFIMREFDKY